jgi:hypothetical protein
MAAEQNAVAWLRWLGHSDANQTGAGPDSGIDVASTTCAAQVKWYGTKVGVRPLRELYGANAGRPVQLFFFCNAGFTRDAIDYASRVGMAAFTFSPADGLIAPANAHASGILEDAQKRHHSYTARVNSGDARSSKPTLPQSVIPTHVVRRIRWVANRILLVVVLLALIGVIYISSVAGKGQAAVPPWMRNVWAWGMTAAVLGGLVAGLLHLLANNARGSSGSDGNSAAEK